MGKLANPTKRQLLAMLDRRWSAYIRTHGKCEHCGTTQNLTDSHIIGRTYLKTRFDPRNNQCVCFSCHGTFESQPLKFAEWVQSTSCGKYVEIMSEQANHPTAKPDYELWFTLYEAITKRNLTVEQAREFLDQRIMLSIADINFQN